MATVTWGVVLSVGTSEVTLTAAAFSSCVCVCVCVCVCDIAL